MVTGISHITFIVEDLERASVFFKTIFDAKEFYTSGEKTFSLGPEKFFLIHDLWICIMEGKALQEQSYNHIAFQISAEELDTYEAKVRSLGLTIRPSRPRIEAEGRSLYFYDYDNHLFELHSGSLHERLLAYNS